MGGVEGHLPPHIPPPGQSELEAAIGAGMLEFWLVASSYAVEDGVLVERGDFTRSYSPGDKPQLTTDFAKLHDGNTSAVLAFARDWGALGYTRLLKRAEDLSPQLRSELLAEARGDPLRWVWAHARGVAACLDLVEYLEGHDEDGLDRYLRTLRGPDGRYPTLMAGRRHGIATVAYQGDERPAEIARWLVSDIVSSNLSGLRLALIHRKDGFRVVQEFAALIDVVYWHLAGLAETAKSKGLARCADCGAMFVRTDRRQRFCPPPPDEAEKAESRCAKRARARRLRHPDQTTP